MVGVRRRQRLVDRVGVAEINEVHSSVHDGRRRTRAGWGSVCICIADVPVAVRGGRRCRLLFLELIAQQDAQGVQTPSRRVCAQPQQSAQTR